MSHEITSDFLDQVRVLARHVGVSEEGIDLLQLQTSSSNNDQQSLVLMASAGEDTLHLLLANWLGEDCRDALRRAGANPLIIGPQPSRLQETPSMRHWAVFQTEQLGDDGGHIVALTATGQLSAKLEANLASAATWNSAVVVTRASQPLPQQERQLVQSLSKVTAIARVLVVAIPGELEAESDSRQVDAYAQSKLQASGFEGPRCNGIYFWWLDRAVRGPHSLANPIDVLQGDPRSLANGRDLMLRTEIVNLLKTIEDRAKASRSKPLAELSEQETSELNNNFGRALNIVRQKAEAECDAVPALQDNDLREFVLDQILSWRNGDELAAVWLSYVDRVRPGAKAGLFDRAKSAVQLLSLSTITLPPEGAGSKEARPSGNLVTSRGFSKAAGSLSDQTLRLFFALLTGILFWTVAAILSWPAIISAVVASAATLAGYVFGEPVISRMRRHTPHDVETADGLTDNPHEGTVKRIRNFNLFEHELRTWMEQHIQSSTFDVAARCRGLRRMLSSDP